MVTAHSIVLTVILSSSRACATVVVWQMGSICNAVLVVRLPSLNSNLLSTALRRFHCVDLLKKHAQYSCSERIFDNFWWGFAGGRWLSA